MSLSTDAYHTIRKRLLNGEWNAGKHISAHALSQELGISRTPVREALTRLATDGLVELVENSGVVVHEIAYDDLSDYLDLRIALEPFAVEKAVMRTTYHELEQLRQLCILMAQDAKKLRDSQFRNEVYSNSLQNHDMQFHQLIHRASGNRQLVKIIEDTSLLTRRIQYPSKQTVSSLAMTLREHWLIYKALKNKDTLTAKSWMENHLRRGARQILDSARFF